MKTFKAILRIFIILLLLISCKDETDDTPEYEFKEYIGNVVLTNYEEVESFGENNYTSITGSLTIELDEYSNNDLAPLLSLNTIGGILYIDDCDALTNLDGLSNLTSVGGLLYIVKNDSLTNIDGLGNLTSVGGYLRIWINNALTNIDGLSNLTSVGDDLVIRENDALTNLDGLSNLTSVGGYLGIWENDALTNFCGITNLITNNGLIGMYNVGYNAYNPTQQDIIDGNCSQ